MNFVYRSKQQGKWIEASKFLSYIRKMKRFDTGSLKIMQLYISH
jgi:hypothetical protein